MFIEVVDFWACCGVDLSGEFVGGLFCWKRSGIDASKYDCGGLLLEFEAAAFFDTSSIVGAEMLAVVRGNFRHEELLDVDDHR